MGNNCTGLCNQQQGKTIDQKEIESTIKNSSHDKPNTDAVHSNSNKSNNKNGATNPPINDADKDKDKDKNEVEEIDMEFMKQNESKIVKMQANMKGRMVRKHMEEQKKNN